MNKGRASGASGALGFGPGRFSVWAAPVLLMLIGMAVRVSIMEKDVLLFPDSTEYLHLAGEIRSGAFFGADFDPDQGFNQSRRRPFLYSLLAAPLLGPFAPERAAAMVSLLVSALSFFPFYFAARDLAGPRSAAAATTLYALHPFLSWYSSPALSEPLFTALYILAFFAGTRALTSPGLGWFALGGAASALLVMTKEAGVAALVVIAGGAIVKHAVFGRVGFRRVVVWLLALSASFGAVGAPYFIEVRLRSGHWALSSQMSASGVSRLVLAGPGDPGAPDRYPLRVTGSGPGPDTRAGGVAAAVSRTVSNLGGYGLAFARGLGPVVLALAVLGAGMRRPGRALTLAWAAGWTVPLWLLYSIVSPFMVDARYMLPLLVPALVLAGSGAGRLMELLAGDGPVPAGPGRLIRIGIGLAAGAGLFLFGPAGLFPEDRVLLRTFAPGFSPLTLAFFVPGAAVLAAAGWGPVQRYWPGAPARLKDAAWLLVLFAAGASLVPQYAAYRTVISPEARHLLFGAGAREAAGELRERGLVPPGRMCASIKPFVPYYLGARWFLDPERHYSVPDTVEDTQGLAAAGAFDFLVLDSFAVRVLKPALGGMALGLDPPPGGALVYGRYFEEYQRMVTVYDFRGPGPDWPECRDARVCVGEARALFASGRVAEASQRLEQALELDRDNRDAWELKVMVFDIYYQCLARPDVPTLAMAPGLLPGWVEAALEVRRLSPGDPNIERLLAGLQAIYARELELMGRPGR